MGPRSFNRGNPVPAKGKAGAMRSFNGAAVFQPRKLRGESYIVHRCQGLQWGRGLSTAEIIDARDNPAPRAALQWGRGLSTAEIPQGPRRRPDALPRFNGAAVFQPRKYGQTIEGPCYYWPLQWGRGLSTAEICHCGFPMPPPVRASMGPRSFNRGNAKRETKEYKAMRASMGPRSFNRGNAIGQTRAYRLGRASMGPRSFNRGNAMAVVYRRTWQKGFNGAAVFQPRKCMICDFEVTREGELQWGRGLSTAEIILQPVARTRPGRASMGPRSFNRGNELVQQWLHLQWSRFNGAAVFQPRKCPAEILRPTQRGCFNGAAVFQPRKSWELPVFRRHSWIASMGPRSFNRGNGRVSWIRGEWHGASMGPRSFNRGNQPKQQSAQISTYRFNGAAVFQPRKFEPVQQTGRLIIPLQWGRGLSTAEIRYVKAPLRAGERASMGPRSFNRGNKKRSEVVSSFEDSFNGAAVFQPRKLPAPGGNFR